jgi:hypothetical protein
MLPGLNWKVKLYPKETTLFEAYYLWPNSEGDHSPEFSATPVEARATGLEINVFVADPQFNDLDAPQFLRKRYEPNARLDPGGQFYQVSEPEPSFDAEPPVLAFTMIANPKGEYEHYAAVTTVGRRADRRFVVYEVTQAVIVGDVPGVWKGPQPRYLLERVRDFPKSFWIFNRDGKQLPQ